MTILKTQRLLLRLFTMDDLDAMALINQDPVVMRFFPSTEGIEQTRDLLKRIMKHQQDNGYSLYAVELKSTREMIGFVGLVYRTKKNFEAPFMPCTEIGWRLGSKHWNKGYATEAARAVLHYAFTDLHLDEIVSFTVVHNQSSRRIMEKLGLHHDPLDDFDHPALASNSPLQRHVLYRLSHDDYLKMIRLPQSQS